MYCTQCGDELKTEARFCHNCGTAVDGSAPAKRGQSPDFVNDAQKKQNWLSSFGPYLFIPIFTGIIILLFWVNKDPEPLKASNTSTDEQSAPSMAAMQQVHKTLERLKKNLEVDPEDLVAIDSLAIMYSIAGSYDKARQYYERHLEVEPDNRDIKIALGLTYNNLVKNDKAIAIIQEVLDVEPTYAFALHYMAEIQTSVHNHDEAVKYWQKIIEIHPDTEFANLAKERIDELDHEHLSN